MRTSAIATDCKDNIYPAIEHDAIKSPKILLWITFGAIAGVGIYEKFGKYSKLS